MSSEMPIFLESADCDGALHVFSFDAFMQAFSFDATAHLGNTPVGREGRAPFVVDRYFR